MKICYKCKKQKPFQSFNKNKAKPDGYQGYCKSCQSEHDKIYYKVNQNRRKNIADRNVKRRKDNQLWLRDLKCNLGCMKCSENHPSCIEFHHRDSKQKEFEISVAVIQGWARKRIIDEIAKCDNLCANCHRKIHWP